MAIQVIKLTQQQKDQLIDSETGKGVKYNSYGHFNPVLDADGNWFISTQEQDACDPSIVPSIHAWLCDEENPIPLIDHNPVVVEL